jgi:hypothetical protein
MPGSSHGSAECEDPPDLPCGAVEAVNAMVASAATITNAMIEYGER